ncbi:MAG: putative quinol monooxygenase [Lachnospiraceae bacterium]
MVTIVVIKYLKEGMLEEWLKAVAPIVEASKSEEGNISYHIQVDQENPNVVIFLEEWESAQYVRESHCATKHVVELVPLLERFYEKPGLEYWTENKI